MDLFTVLRNIYLKIKKNINVERITNTEIDDAFGSASGTGTDAQDYVIEHGTIGSWTYRKWASGVGECWLSNYQLNLTSKTSYGGGYFSAITNMVYPFAFVSVPHINVNNRSGPNGGLIATDVPYNVTTSNFSIMIWNPESYDTSGAGYVTWVNVYVKGNWK